MNALGKMASGRGVFVGFVWLIILFVLGYVLVNVRMEVAFFSGQDIFSKYQVATSPADALRIAQDAYFAKTAFLLILLVAAFHLLLHSHRFGNHVFATGGNRGAAEAIGINTGRVKLIGFGIAGGMAAVAGILATTRVGSVQPGQGAGLELQAIAACVIGGLSLRGGRGSIIGIFLGVLLIHTITDVLLLLRAPGFYLDMFIATLIVLAAIFNHLIERRGLA